MSILFSEAGVEWDEINDEIDDHTVLQLSCGLESASGFLELKLDDSVDMNNPEEMHTYWLWTVNEPLQQEVYQGTAESIDEAIIALKNAMEQMNEFVLERDAETDEEGDTE